MGQPKSFWPFGTPFGPLDPFGPFQTKMIFLPQMDKIGFCRGASEQNIRADYFYFLNLLFFWLNDIASHCSYGIHSVLSNGFPGRPRLWCLVQIKWKISFVVTFNKINGVYITFYFFIYGNKNMFSSPSVYCIMKTFSSFTDERAIFSIFRFVYSN